MACINPTDVKISYQHSGLDPAGMYFEIMPIQHRLNITNAKFVDVIHTSSLGIIHSIGHVDIYVNFGNLSPQPGCLKDNINDNSE